MLVAAVVVLLPAMAAAASSTGIEHLKFAAGPYKVIPGANLILTQYNKVPKPNVDGFMIRMAPNLRLRAAQRQVLRQRPADQERPPPSRRMAERRQRRVRGEGDGLRPLPLHGLRRGEDDQIEFPPGYGYPVAAKDHWILNYMIHNLTDKPTHGLHHL